MTTEKELLAAVAILRQSFENGEDLTALQTLSPQTRVAFDLTRDFFRGRGDNDSRHFWLYKKALHRFFDVDDEHLRPGAELLYRQYLNAMCDSVVAYCENN